jgi:hypothetical protein
MRISKQRVLVTLKSLMERPKWWNEAFSRYDQKRLQAWAEDQRTKSLEYHPKLDIPETSFSDRVVLRELYRPYVARSNQGFIA